MNRRKLLPIAWLATALLLGGCGETPSEANADSTAQRLIGTWLREYTQDEARVRRVLVLQPDGLFREASRADHPTGRREQHAHAGNWLFDGINLKRKYTSIDGEPPSAPMVPFATFQIRFESRNEFVGVDNLRKREVRYRRVEEATEP